MFVALVRYRRLVSTVTHLLRPTGARAVRRRAPAGVSSSRAGSARGRSSALRRDPARRQHVRRAAATSLRSLLQPGADTGVDFIVRELRLPRASATAARRPRARRRRDRVPARARATRSRRRTSSASPRAPRWRPSRGSSSGNLDGLALSRRRAGRRPRHLASSSTCSRGATGSAATGSSSSASASRRFMTSRDRVPHLQGRDQDARAAMTWLVGSSGLAGADGDPGARASRCVLAVRRHARAGPAAAGARARRRHGRGPRASRVERDRRLLMLVAGGPRGAGHRRGRADRVRRAHGRARSRSGCSGRRGSRHPRGRRCVGALLVLVADLVAQHAAARPAVHGGRHGPRRRPVPRLAADHVPTGAEPADDRHEAASAT